MHYRFAEFELDPGRQELRNDGRLVAVQPLVLSLLRYLIEAQGRVVSKEELLRQVWATPYVTDGALARAVSQARRALGEAGHRLIRTHARRGYRFTAEVEAVEERDRRDSAFRPRYARSGDVHIAYAVLGGGAGTDIVLVTGWAFPMAAIFEWPPAERFCRQLSALGRLILFDKRGTGLSDRVHSLPSLERRIEDLDAVLAATGSERPVLLGVSEGAPMCLLHATLHPRRVRGLVLCGGFARMSSAPDYPVGWSQEESERLRSYIENGWGRGETVLALSPDRTGDPELQAWAARAEQAGASPGAAMQLLEMNVNIDVREILGAVRVPTVVLHARDDRVISVEAGRYLASRIPGARLIELPGRSHAPWELPAQRVVQMLRELDDEAAEGLEEERFLATVLCVELPAAGVERRELRLRHARERLAAAGLEVLPGGSPLLALCDRPARAVELALGEVARREGDAEPARAGLYTSELVRREAGVEGAAIGLAQRLAAAAPPGEVLVTHTVTDLVAGSGLRFTSHQDLTPPGYAGSLRTFRVEPPGL